MLHKVPFFCGKNMGKIVGLTYDLKTDRTASPEDPVDINAELDSMETVEVIGRAFESGGHQVKKIGNVRNLLAQIKDLDVDIVFNICEGYFGRNRESEVPQILEMYGIPFVGADALTLGLTLDKVMAKKCFIADGVPTAPYFVAHSTENLKKLNRIGYPLIVKPRFEGTSKGLTEASRVKNLAELTAQVELITKKYRQPALVEKFISGTEFTVPIIGNNPPEAMPIVQIAIDEKTDLGDMFYTYDRVVREQTVRYACPAKISKALTKKLQETAVRAYQSVDCRDFGRVDFRVDAKGQPYVLEINPLPSLALKDAFNIFPQTMGSTYNQILNRILDYALERYGLKKSAHQTKNSPAASGAVSHKR